MYMDMHAWTPVDISLEGLRKNLIEIQGIKCTLGNILIFEHVDENTMDIFYYITLILS